MSNYTPIVSYAPKDALSPGDPNKKILGTQMDAELTAIATAISSKGDTANVAVLSAANTFTGTPQLLSNTNPSLDFNETDGAANNRRWRFVVAAEAFFGQAMSDALATVSWLTVNRTDQTIDSVNLQGTAILGNSIDLTPSEGTFTFTITGCTTSPTGTGRYVKHGNIVVLHIPTITGTSNSTSLTFTGLPAAIQTARTVIVGGVAAINNGVDVNGYVTFTVGSGTMTWHNGDAFSLWTNSGLKGGTGGCITYSIS